MIIRRQDRVDLWTPKDGVYERFTFTIPILWLLHKLLFIVVPKIMVPWGNCPLNTIPFDVFMRLTDTMNFHSERLAIDAKCWLYFSPSQMSNSVYSQNDFLILKQEHIRVAHKKYMRRFFIKARGRRAK